MSESQTIQDLLKKTGADSPGGDVAATAQSKLEEKMHDIRLKEKEEQTKQAAEAAGLSYVNLKTFPIAPEALTQIPREIAEKFKVVCFLYTGAEVRIASSLPDQPVLQEILHQIEERTKAEGGLYQISEESLRLALLAYDALPKIKKIVKGVNITEEEVARFQGQIKTFKDIQPLIEGAPISDVMVAILAAALHFNASDVHIEAKETSIAIRFRLDGFLQDVASLSQEKWKQIISRIKLISGLKINVDDLPQDGRFTIFLKSGDTDVRVSTIPTVWGESVVLRVLKPTDIKMEFADLGWRPEIEKKLTKEIEKPHGMIMTTGPTGSGKTTTLYAILRKLNSPDVNIVTLEDPIEYKLAGINQTQIEHSKDLTFANGLRSLLRQDPDIVMGGEIRDLETADVAINAALTGHLMLSTLHTNDAAGALPRFISMGVKPFLIGPALNAIIGQRLVRRLHADCKEATILTPEQLATVKKIMADWPISEEKLPPMEEWKFYKGRGCDLCNHTGFKGRIGIYEFLNVSEPIRAALAENISEYQVRQLAKEQGMATLQQDGMFKALQGITSVDEVLRVAGE